MRDAVFEPVEVGVGVCELVSDPEAVLVPLCVPLGVCVPVGEGGTDASAQLPFCGGSATPRNTVPVGATASTTVDAATVLYAYSVVLEEAYRTKEPPTVRPAME